MICRFGRCVDLIERRLFTSSERLGRLYSDGRGGNHQIIHSPDLPTRLASGKSAHADDYESMGWCICCGDFILGLAKPLAEPRPRPEADAPTAEAKQATLFKQFENADQFRDEWTIYPRWRSAADQGVVHHSFCEENESGRLLGFHRAHQVRQKGHHPADAAAG